MRQKTLSGQPSCTGGQVVANCQKKPDRQLFNLVFRFSCDFQPKSRFFLGAHKSRQTLFCYPVKNVNSIPESTTTNLNKDKYINHKLFQIAQTSGMCNHCTLFLTSPVNLEMFYFDSKNGLTCIASSYKNA